MLRELRELQDIHFDLVLRLLGGNEAGKSASLRLVDFLLLSVIQRSLDLVEGFCGTYDNWNLSTAAPLVRLQIDNLLRLSLLTVASNDSVVSVLLSEERLDQQQDPLAPPGKKAKLTDALLREYARSAFPWVDTVYKHASRWVHFSNVHVAATLQFDEDGKTFSGRFPTDIHFYPLEFLEQVLSSMIRTTEGILTTTVRIADMNGMTDHVEGLEDA